MKGRPGLDRRMGPEYSDNSEASVISELAEVTPVSKEETQEQAGSSAPCTCCRVDAIVSVDERGQMVLPKELRDKAGIGAGEKLAAVSWQKGDEICCISLIKVADLTGMVKGMLGPIMADVLEK